MTELKTRKPTGRPSWPLILLAGSEKTGKSYAAAALSASPLVDRTLWIEIGEGSADLYGALPGARYEIVEHDGSYAGILNAAAAATQQPARKNPHAIVIDSMTELWDMMSDEQQIVANRRAAAKGRKADEAPIAMDQWNTAKKRWRRFLDVLRAHNGPVILTARFEKVATVGADGKPTADKEWKIRAEKNLPFEVDVIVEMPKPRDYYLTGVRSLALQIPPGGHMPYPSFTLERLLTDLGLANGQATARQYTAPRPEAFADVTAGPEHEQLRQDTLQGDKAITRERRKSPPADDSWTTAPKLPDKQRKALMAAFGNLGIEDRDQRLTYCQKVIGLPIGTTNALTPDDYQKVLASLQADLDAAAAPPLPDPPPDQP